MKADKLFIYKLGKCIMIVDDIEIPDEIGGQFEIDTTDIDLSGLFSMDLLDFKCNKHDGLIVSGKLMIVYIASYGSYIKLSLYEKSGLITELSGHKIYFLT